MRVLPQDPGALLIVHTDGAARGNPGPAGIGAILTDEEGRVVDQLARGIGVATNNVAEYRAALEGLRLASERGAGRVVLRSDSRLLVEQLMGRYRVKAPALQRLHEEVRSVLGSFREAVVEHVPREENAEADRLANEGVDEWLATEGKDYRPPEPPPALFEE